jgi:periplasmic protein TonB
MVSRLIESSRRAGGWRLFRSGAAALLAHAALAAAAGSATLGPASVADAGVPIVIEWPQQSDHHLPSPPPESILGAVGETWDVPIDVPRGLPPIDAGVLFDAKSLVTSVTQMEDAPRGLSGADAPWSPDVVEERPALLAGPAPHYPELLRRAGIQGRIVVQAVIDTLGHAEAVSLKVVQSPDAGFDAPGLEYVLHSVFRPARVHGRAVRVVVQVPIDFTLTRPY